MSEVNANVRPYAVKNGKCLYKLIPINDKKSTWYQHEILASTETK